MWVYWILMSLSRRMVSHSDPLGAGSGTFLSCFPTWPKMWCQPLLFFGSLFLHHSLFIALLLSRSLEASRHEMIYRIYLLRSQAALNLSLMLFQCTFFCFFSLCFPSAISLPPSVHPSNPSCLFSDSMFFTCLTMTYIINRLTQQWAGSSGAVCLLWGGHFANCLFLLKKAKSVAKQWICSNSVKHVALPAPRQF